jgi:uncharacterized membrane protein YfcA
VLEALAILAAGMAAGAINAVVGSGTLITFPVLLAAGYQPVVANVSNTIGLVPGSLAGAVGYRRELAGQRPRLTRLAPASLAGGITGAAALLLLPERLFEAIVPVFIALALVLVVVQRRLDVALARMRPHEGERPRTWAVVAVFAAGVYGGYFGAAQGILLLAILGVALRDHLQRINALKWSGRDRQHGGRGRLRLRGRRGLGAGRAHRGGLDRRRMARRALRAPPGEAHLRGLVVAVGVVAILQLALG